MIVELLEHAADVPDAEAATHYFAGIAEDNDAAATARVEASTALTAAHMPSMAMGQPGGAARATAHFLSGRQLVSKARESDAARNDVRILLAVLRLPDVMTDILISMNVPLAFSAVSSAAPAADAAAGIATSTGAAQQAQAGGAGSSAAGMTVVSQATADAATAAFFRLLATFRVVRYSLFTPMEDAERGPSAPPAAAAASDTQMANA